MQKVVVKRVLTPKQRFELLFKNLSNEDKELIKMDKILNSSIKLSQYDKSKFINRNKKFICKIKKTGSIKAIVEDLNNGFYIVYYRYSGDALLYNSGKFITVISEGLNIMDYINIPNGVSPWLLAYNSIDKKFCLRFDKSRYKSYFEQILTELVKDNGKYMKNVIDRFKIYRKQYKAIY